MEVNEVIETLRANRSLLEQFHVRSLSVFGSIVRGEAGPESDMDILVEFDPGAKVGLFAFARLQRWLQDLLGRQVDLATPKALHKALKQRILEEAVAAVLWEYFLGVMLLAAYREFEKRTGELTSAHGAKSEMVMAAIQKLPATFNYGDLAQACPNVSRPTIKRVLARLSEEGAVKCVKSGRDALWKKMEP
jgi:predicted nucleotidyltransferase